MPSFNTTNWTDAQWYNFICGIISKSKLVPRIKPEPVPTEDPEIDTIYIRDFIHVRMSDYITHEERTIDT